MARIRTIKPSFFTSEDTCKCSRDARLLFIGMWTEADREGRIEDRPGQLKIRLFPSEDDMNIGALLNELHAAGLIERYSVGDKAIIQIVNFKVHQRPHPKESQSELPAFDRANAEVIPPRQPLVYFILDSIRNAVKIGVSAVPEHRLYALQGGHANKLELLGVSAGGFQKEKELHRRLAAFRLQGEWFEFAAEVKAEVESQISSRPSREQVGKTPGESPSGPPIKGREGDLESGVLGREGNQTPPQRPGIQGRGAFEAGTLQRDHLRHGYCGPGYRLCLNQWEFNELAKQFGGSDPNAARTAIEAFVDELVKALGENQSPGGFKEIEKEFQVYLRKTGRLSSAPRLSADANQNSAHERELRAIKDGTYGR